MREMTELPSQWHPELRHRTALIPHSEENREVAWSLAREGWDVTELWLLICRVPPKVPAAAKPVEGEARRRLKGRLGVELGLPPDKTPSSTATTSSALARRPTSPTAGYEDGQAALARLDVPARRHRGARGRRDAHAARAGAGLGKAAVMGATAAALRLSARAVYLFAEPDVAKRFYLPLGFEQIGSAWDCEKAPPGEKRDYR